MIKCMRGWGIQPGMFLTPLLSILCWNGTKMVSNESWCVHLSNFLKYDTIVLKKLLNLAWLDSSSSHTFNALLLSNLKIWKNFHNKSHLLELPTCSKHTRMLILNYHTFFSRKCWISSGWIPQPPIPLTSIFYGISKFSKISYTTPTIGTPHMF